MYELLHRCTESWMINADSFCISCRMATRPKNDNMVNVAGDLAIFRLIARVGAIYAVEDDRHGFSERILAGL